MAAPLRSTNALRPHDKRRVTARDAPRGAAHLTVVPGGRRMAWFVFTLTALVGIVMVGAVLLHTRLAERQLEIDGLTRSVREAQDEFDVLRAQRAELRSPTNLAVRAGALGMEPGDESVFIDIDPMVLAVSIARSGEMPVSVESVLGGESRGDADQLDPLDQHRLVKSLSSETP